MSQENVEIVRGIYRAWQRGDFSSYDWADPAIEFHIRSGPDDAVHHGVEAMGRAWRDWLGAWEDFKTECPEFIDAGDEVLVLATFRGRGRASGLPIEGMPGAALFSLRDGKVVRLGTYTDPAEARQELGRHS
jgi:ketosteroid isomerase-like protein